MIIAIVNQKGGTGKTTTVVNLGCALTKKGKRVMLIDMDPQGNLSYSLGIRDINTSIADVLINRISIKDTIVEREGADVIPADIRLSSIAITVVDNREYILKNALNELESYDYILIDCPPSLSKCFKCCAKSDSASSNGCIEP